MLQNGVGWITNSSIRGTTRLAICSWAVRSPITPPIMPVVPVPPIVPVRPAPPPRAIPAPIVPPISPSELLISVFQFLGADLLPGHGRGGLADRGQSLRDPILAGG